MVCYLFVDRQHDFAADHHVCQQRLGRVFGVDLAADLSVSHDSNNIGDFQNFF